MTAAPFRIAVDPGAGGGLAWCEPGKGVQACKMPDTDEKLLHCCRAIMSHAAEVKPFKNWDATCAGVSVPAPRPAQKVIVSIELVGGYVKPAKIVRNEGIKDWSKEDEFKIEGGQPGSAMFKFGENAGLVRGIFLGLGAEVELIPPKRWQEPLFLKKGRMSKEDWKRVLKNAAQRKFPGVKVTLAKADALLILAFVSLRDGSGAVLSPGTCQRGQGEAGVMSPPAGNKPAQRPPCAICKLPANDSLHFDDEQGHEYEPAEPAERLFVGDWSGAESVFRKTAAGKIFYVRKANEADLRELPRGNARK